MKKILYTCPECGSENVMHDAYVMMNDEDDVRTFDNKVCDDCSAAFNQAVETEVDVPDELPIDVAVPDPEPKVLRGDELVYTVRSMRGFGGSFVQHIGAALQTADSSNAVRLQQAFPDLIEKYGPGTDFYNAVQRASEI